MKQKILTKFKSPRIKGIALHHTKPLLAMCLYNGTFIHYDTKELKPLLTIKVSELPLRACSFYSNFLLIGCDDGNIFIYEGEKRVGSFSAHKDFIRKIAVSGKEILTCSDDTTIKQWHLKDNKLILVNIFDSHSHFVMDISFHPANDKRFVSASLDQTVKVWNIGNKKELFTLTGHSDGVNSAIYNNEYIISCSDDLTTKIWDNQKCIYTIRGHTKNINRINTFENFFVTCSEDGYIKIYNKKIWKLESSINIGMERVWDVVKVDDKLFIACDEGMTVISYGKSSFNIAMNSGRIFYNTGEHLFGLKTDNLNLVKEVGFLDYLPSFIKINKKGKMIALGDETEFYIYNILGFRIKEKGKGTNFFFADDGYALQNNDDVEITINEQKKIHKHKFIEKLIGVKDNEIYCCVLKKEAFFTNVYNGNKILLSISGKYEKSIFYENFIIFLGKGITISKIDYSMASDFIEQGLECTEIEEHYKTIFQNIRNCNEYFLKDDILFYSSNNKLYYIILDDHIQECIFGTFEGVFCGVYENNLYFYCNKKVISKSIYTEYINWQRNILKSGEIDYLLSVEYNEQAVSFLMNINKVDEALKICSDEGRRFDLYVQLKKYKDAYKIANNSIRYKILMKEFLKKGDYTRSAECAYKAKDWNNLYLLNCLCKGNYQKEILKGCEGRNLEFLVAYKEGLYEKCFDMIRDTKYGQIFKNHHLS